MTRNEAVAFVKQHLGFKTALDATIVSNMKLQQQKLELMPIKPWFLLSEKSYSFTTAGERRVILPVDFLEEYEDGCLFYKATGLREVALVKDEYDVLFENYKEDDSGPPEAYALDGGYFSIFPLPDAVYRIEMKYYKKADLLDQPTTENAWLKYIPELLIGKAGMAVASSIRDFNAVKVFEQMVSENMLLLNSQNEARKHNNFEMQMGGPH